MEGNEEGKEKTEAINDAAALINFMEYWNAILEDREETFKKIDSQMISLEKRMEEKRIREICGDRSYEFMHIRMREHTRLHSVWKDDRNGESIVIHGMFSGDEGFIIPLQTLSRRPELNTDAYLKFWQNQVGKPMHEIKLILIGINQKEIVNGDY
jgi:uncharacterized protein Usg